MPGFDGTGPSGQGPMSGQGRGFCVLKSSETKPYQLHGFAGLQGVPVDHIGENLEKNSKKKINMSSANGRDPAISGPRKVKFSSLYSRYLLPWDMNHDMARIGCYGRTGGALMSFSLSPYGYGVNYAMPYISWMNPWLRRRFGQNWGRGRGRFGYCW